MMMISIDHLSNQYMMQKTAPMEGGFWWSALLLIVDGLWGSPECICQDALRRELLDSTPHLHSTTVRCILFLPGRTLWKILRQFVLKTPQRIRASRHCFQCERERFCQLWPLYPTGDCRQAKTLEPELQLATAGGTEREADFRGIAVFEGLPA
jgi:hypothetical protein